MEAPPLSTPPELSSPAQRYSSFSPTIRHLILFLVSLLAILSPISSNIFVPAIPTLAIAFRRTEQEISLAVTIFLIFQAVTPMIFGSLSDCYGRRVVYMGTLSVYLASNVGLAVIPTSPSGYVGLLVLRALQATGGSALLSVGAGCVSDIAEPQERGKFMSLFQLGSTVGPALGPLLGGVLAEYWGWRGIFWFLAILTGVLGVPTVLWLPETLRSLVGDGSEPAPRIATPPFAILNRQKTRSTSFPLRKDNYRPFESLRVLKSPEILLTFIFVSLPYLEYYAYLTVLSAALKSSYQLNELQIGLCYLSSGFGTIVCASIQSRVIDTFYRRELRRAGGDYQSRREEFRLERARFLPILPFLLVFWAACVGVGWCLETRVNLGVTIAISFFVGLGSGFVSPPTVYGQDLFPVSGGAVSAALNLVRCLFGAVGTGTIQLAYQSLNPGWTFVLFTGVCVAAIPLPVIVVKRAKFWRLRRQGVSRSGSG